MRMLLLVASMALACPSLAMAQDEAGVTSDLEGEEVVPLRRGRAAPRDGLLIDPTLLLRLHFDIDRLEHRLQADLARAEERCGVRVEMEEARTTAATERAELRDSLWRNRERDLVNQVAAAQEDAKRGWHENPALWAGVGAVVASLVAVLAASL